MPQAVELHPFPGGASRIAAHHRLTRRRTWLWTLYAAFVLTPAVYALGRSAVAEGAAGAALFFGGLIVAVAGFAAVIVDVRRRGRGPPGGRTTRPNGRRPCPATPCRSPSSRPASRSAAAGRPGPTRR